MTPNIHYENREIEGERLELTDKTAIYWLGPNITLRGCTLVTSISARWLHLVSGSLIDCTSSLAGTDGVSMNRNPDTSATGGFVLHTSLSTLSSSAGKRANGTAF